ncbi:F-box domain containing protein [Tanacetum coccineum]
MDRLPSNVMFDIFSRIPVKCLARSRCVSKVWCEYIDDRYLTTVHDKRVIEEPTPILYHTRLFQDRKFRSLCFHVIESKQTETGTPLTYVLEPKEYPFLEFLRKKPLKKSSDVRIEVRGSCNGLMCLSQDDDDIVTSLVVVHPLKKERYKVPPLPMHFDLSMFRESCGLGFDASTNTLKMVCVLLKDHGAVPSKDHDMVRKNLCTMVHEIGTNSWREIPQVPPYHITDGAVFANGCLHWLVSHIDIMTEDGGRPVIRFDVEKEEFGLIDPPKRMCDIWRGHNSCIDDHLVDLNGEVGFVCVRTMEIWVLKQKKWVPYCRLENTIVPDGRIDVLGCWNRDGDMLIRNVGIGYKFFIYNLKSGVLHKTSIACPENGCDPNIFMHPNKLFSIHGIGTNSSPLKKTNLKRSCQHLLSCY